MLKIEMKTCKNCGKIYTWKSGGIVARPKDFMDFGMCPACRGKTAKGTVKKVIEDLFIGGDK